MFVSPKEPSIIANNELSSKSRIGDIQAQQAFNTPAMQEIVAVTTQCNTGENSTPQRVIRTGIDVFTLAESCRVTSVVASCTAPPYVFNWDSMIGIKQQTTTINFSKSIKLNTFIDRFLSNDLNAPFVSS